MVRTAAPTEQAGTGMEPIREPEAAPAAPQAGGTPPPERSAAIARGRRWWRAAAARLRRGPASAPEPRARRARWRFPIPRLRLRPLSTLWSARATIRSRLGRTRRWLAGRRLRAVALVAIVLLGAAAIGGGMLWRARQTPAAAPAPPLAGALAIQAPTTAHVGDAIVVTVGPAPARDGLPATLLMVGSYGPRIYRGAFAAGIARFQIPGDDTRQSGAATLIASADAARGEGTLTLTPDAPTDPVTPLVGARSIAADGRHWSMAVAVPFDRFGNPVAEGTPVELRALHPGDALEIQHAEVRHMLAWARIFSRTRAGRTTVSMSSAGKHGPDATFMEVPGWPAPFDLSASPADVPADGRQLVTLRTDVIRDQFGNPMLDGTLVTFVVETPTGEPRFIPAYTIDGVAKTQLQAPGEPGSLTVRAEVYNAESRPLVVTFAAGPAVGAFPIAAHVDAAGQSLELVAGPMLGPLQQFVPDGTPVQFVLTDAVGRQTRVEAVSEGGYAHAVARLATLQVGTYTAEATVGAGSGKLTFQVP